MSLVDYRQDFRPGIFKINQNILKAFEKVDIRILLFLILCINFLSFTVSDNEEAQLSLAKQFMDHAWMPNSFSFNEWPGNRFLFQMLSGFALRYVEFEPFVFFARMLVFLFISIPLGAIFRKLGIKNIYALIFFQIYLLHQSYFGAEFIFRDYETKSLAYIFVLSGVYCLLNNKFLLAVFSSIIACYIHVLVGAGFFVLVFIYTIFRSKSFTLILKELLLFTVLFLPQGYFLGREIFSSGSVVNGVNIDWVYAYFRNPHHTTPLSVKGMRTEVILQMSITGLLFLSTLFIFRRFRGEFLDKLYTMNVIVFSILFISVGISLIDKTGFILKFYLFRIAALGCFLMLLYTILMLKLIPAIPELIKSLLFVSGFCLIIAAANTTFHQIFRADPKPGFHELVNYIKQNTGPEDVFLTMGDYELSFSRKTRRDEFVVYKFVPFGGKKIYEWYIRMLERMKLWDDLSEINYLKKKYRLNYFLCDHDVDEGQYLKLVFHNKTYSLYKILGN